MDNTIEFLTNKEDIEKRLDVFLSKKMENITRSNIKKIIDEKTRILPIYVN